MTTKQIITRFGSTQIAANVADQKIQLIEDVMSRFSLSSGTVRRYKNQLIEWNSIRKEIS